MRVRDRDVVLGTKPSSLVLLNSEAWTGLGDTAARQGT